MVYVVVILAIGEKDRLLLSWIFRPSGEKDRSLLSWIAGDKGIGCYPGPQATKGSALGRIQTIQTIQKRKRMRMRKTKKTIQEMKKKRFWMIQKTKTLSWKIPRRQCE
jgi:hypothetical protein